MITNNLRMILSKTRFSTFTNISSDNHIWQNETGIISFLLCETQTSFDNDMMKTSCSKRLINSPKPTTRYTPFEQRNTFSGLTPRYGDKFVKFLTVRPPLYGAAWGDSQKPP